jgi:AcrR family transcriptional regulator
VSAPRSQRKRTGTARKKKAARIPKAKGQYHHGNLQEALIAAALELISSEGPAALSLRALARRAKVSTAAPYRHFASREAVLAAVAAEGFRGLAAAIAETRAIEDPVARLAAGGVAYVRFATEHRAHYAVMFSPELVDRTDYPDLAEAAMSAFQLLLESIAACQEADLIVDDDPQRLALVAWSTVHGLSALIGAGHLGHPSFADTDELSSYVADRLIEGVLPR